MIKALKDLGFVYSKVETSKAICNCLDELKDAILIENPNEQSLSILQTNSEDHFYLGFDGVLESKGIIFVNNSDGTNTIGLCARTILIIRDLALANKFLRAYYDNPHINFFNLEETNRLKYDQKKLSEIVTNGIQTKETLRWWMNRY